MKIYDIHVHTTFSHDGRSTIEQYAKLLGKGKLSGIGFAEHVDFMPECGGYGQFDYGGYISGVERCKAQGHNVYAGAEVDYAESVLPDIFRYLQEKPFDYVVASVHMINGLSTSDGRNTRLFDDTSVFRDFIEKYYYQVESSLSVKQFDVIGHIGIYKRHLYKSFFGSAAARDSVTEADYSLAKACARSGKILEVNSSGLFSAIGSILPDADFLAEYRRCGGRLVCTGSDAHGAAEVGRGFDRVKEILSSIGFRYLTLPWAGGKNIRI